jgi:hypothetical protein
MKIKTIVAAVAAMGLGVASVAVMASSPSPSGPFQKPTSKMHAAKYNPEAVKPMLAGPGSKQKTELLMLQSKVSLTALMVAAKNNPMAVKPILAGLGSKKNRTAHVAK